MECGTDVFDNPQGDLILFQSLNQYAEKLMDEYIKEVLAVAGIFSEVDDYLRYHIKHKSRRSIARMKIISDGYISIK